MHLLHIHFKAHKVMRVSRVQDSSMSASRLVSNVELNLY